MLYCPIFRVGTTEIIYHDGDANYVHEIMVVGVLSSIVLQRG
jgi:hypothetical protein